MLGCALSLSVFSLWQSPHSACRVCTLPAKACLTGTTWSSSQVPAVSPQPHSAHLPSCAARVFCLSAVEKSEDVASFLALPPVVKRRVAAGVFVEFLTRNRLGLVHPTRRAPLFVFIIFRHSFLSISSVFYHHFSKIFAILFSFLLASFISPTTLQNVISSISSPHPFQKKKFCKIYCKKIFVIKKIELFKNDLSISRAKNRTATTSPAQLSPPPNPLGKAAP